MYNSLILPHLHYCIAVCGFETNILYKLQKKAIGTVTKSKFNAHTGPLFKEFSLLKLSDIFKMQCLKLFFNVRHQHLPHYFLSCFTLNETVHSYQTRNRLNIHITSTNTSSAQNCIRIYYIHKLLTDLPT